MAKLPNSDHKISFNNQFLFRFKRKKITCFPISNQTVFFFFFFRIAYSGLYARGWSLEFYLGLGQFAQVHWPFGHEQEPELAQPQSLIFVFLVLARKRKKRCWFVFLWPLFSVLCESVDDCFLDRSNKIKLRKKKKRKKKEKKEKKVDKNDN